MKRLYHAMILYSSSKVQVLLLFKKNSFAVENSTTNYCKWTKKIVQVINLNWWSIPSGLLKVLKIDSDAHPHPCTLTLNAASLVGCTARRSKACISGEIYQKEKNKTKTTPNCKRCNQSWIQSFMILIVSIQMAFLQEVDLITL